MHIFLTFLNGYIHPNNFKNKNKLWGFAPNPTHLRGRRGRWQTLSTYPYGECWVDSKASRVKCTTSSPLTPLHLRGGSKTNRKRTELETRQGLRSNRVAAWPLQVGGDPTLCGKGAGGFSLHPCHVANAGVGSAHGVGKTLGGRAVGGKCAVGTHFKGFVYKAQSQLCVALLGCLVIGGRMSAVSLKLPHAPCAPLSLDNLQVLVQSLPMAFG